MSHDEFFRGGGPVYRALDRITSRLDEIGVPYAVVGGLALNAHGYERLTTDVDLLVTPESLVVVHDRLEGLGYVPPFANSKHLRDTVDDVRIEFLTTGAFPGDGKPKPVAFPDPRDVAVDLDGVNYLSVPALVTLKLASGMSNANRIKDIADVQELIKAAGLSASLADELPEYVRGKFLELHGYANTPDPFDQGA